MDLRIVSFVHGRKFHAPWGILIGRIVLVPLKVSLPEYLVMDTLGVLKMKLVSFSSSKKNSLVLGRGPWRREGRGSVEITSVPRELPARFKSRREREREREGALWSKRAATGPAGNSRLW